MKTANLTFGAATLDDWQPNALFTTKYNSLMLWQSFFGVRKAFSSSASSFKQIIHFVWCYYDDVCVSSRPNPKVINSFISSSMVVSPATTCQFHQPQVLWLRTTSELAVAESLRTWDLVPLRLPWAFPVQVHEEPRLIRSYPNRVTKLNQTKQTKIQSETTVSKVDDRS